MAVEAAAAMTVGRLEAAAAMTADRPEVAAATTVDRLEAAVATIPAEGAGVAMNPEAEVATTRPEAEAGMTPPEAEADMTLEEGAAEIEEATEVEVQQNYSVDHCATEVYRFRNFLPNQTKLIQEYQYLERRTCHL